VETGSHPGAGRLRDPTLPAIGNFGDEQQDAPHSEQNFNPYLSVPLRTFARGFGGPLLVCLRVSFQIIHDSRIMPEGAELHTDKQGLEKLQKF
jgi:hypothetical protein